MWMIIHCKIENFNIISIIHCENNLSEFQIILLIEKKRKNEEENENEFTNIIDKNEKKTITINYWMKKEEKWMYWKKWGVNWCELWNMNNQIIQNSMYIFMNSFLMRNE